MDRLRYLIGLATLVVTAVAAWFLIGLLREDDRAGFFTLRVEFRDVHGLKAGADVKYRGVRAGTVYSVELSEDGEKGIALVVLDEGVERFARLNSQFWIVVPRFGGITSGATGLDTLVRDAYVAFMTPDPAGPAMAPGGLIAGLESPGVEQGEENLGPIRHGDLEMIILAAENHGLRPGAEVVFRGITTGDVRGIELAEDGSHVQVRLRIHQRYRKTVTDKSQFWVARPRLSGALLGGFAIEDLSALLRPFVGYHSAPGEGLPVPDNYRAAALPKRPDLGDQEISAEIVEKSQAIVERVIEPDEVRVVQVIYKAEEEDWSSANDHVARTGTGLLFIDRSGRAVVVTPRTLCDASFFMDDTFGTEPDIKSEAIRIAVPGGTVLRAGRAWVAPEGVDLALLVIEDAPRSLPTTPGSMLDFGSDPGAGGTGPIHLVRAEDETRTVLQPGSLPPIEENRGGVAVRGERVIGILGQKAAFDLEPVLCSLDSLPPELRPGS